MNPVRRAAILKLTATAYEMDLHVLNGKLTRDANGRWQVGGHGSLDDWLAKYEGQEVAVILGAMEEDREVRKRTCSRCGRDYEDLECPTCRANRIRLRGRA